MDRNAHAADQLPDVQINLFELQNRGKNILTSPILMDASSLTLLKEKLIQGYKNCLHEAKEKAAQAFIPCGDFMNLNTKRN